MAGQPCRPGCVACATDESHDPPVADPPGTRCPCGRCSPDDIARAVVDRIAAPTRARVADSLPVLHADDASRLTVSLAAGSVVLDGSLLLLAESARYGDGLLLPFTYRALVDPEAPDAPRPRRRARLVILDDGPDPDDMPGPRYNCMTLREPHPAHRWGDDDQYVCDGAPLPPRAYDVNGAPLTLAQQRAAGSRP